MNVEDLMLYDDMEQHYKKLRDTEAHNVKTANPNEEEDSFYIPESPENLSENSSRANSKLRTMNHSQVSFSHSSKKSGYRKKKSKKKKGGGGRSKISRMES